MSSSKRKKKRKNRSESFQESNGGYRDRLFCVSLIFFYGGNGGNYENWRRKSLIWDSRIFQKGFFIRLLLYSNGGSKDIEVVEVRYKMVVFVELILLRMRDFFEVGLERNFGEKNCSAFSIFRVVVKGCKVLVEKWDVTLSLLCNLWNRSSCSEFYSIWGMKENENGSINFAGISFWMGNFRWYFKKFRRRKTKYVFWGKKVKMVLERFKNSRQFCDRIAILAQPRKFTCYYYIFLLESIVFSSLIFQPIFHLYFC